MSRKIVSNKEIGEGFVSPKEIDEAKYIGSIFIEDKNSSEYPYGFVYQEIDSGEWVLETCDSISDQMDTFEELYDEFLDGTQFIAIVRE